MNSIMPSQCPACRRKRPTDAPTCDAFPGGIPDVMLTGGGDHRVGLANDNGVRFEQRDTEQAREAFADWQSVFGG